MDIERIKKSIRNIPDFPKPGIQFKDITTLLQNNNAFGETIDYFYNTFKNKKIDVIVGIESRGSIRCKSKPVLTISLMIFPVFGGISGL